LLPASKIPFILTVKISVDKEKLPEKIIKEFHKFTKEYDKFIVKKIYKS